MKENYVDKLYQRICIDEYNARVAELSVPFTFTPLMIKDLLAWLEEHHYYLSDSSDSEFVKFSSLPAASRTLVIANYLNQCSSTLQLSFDDFKPVAFHYLIDVWYINAGTPVNRNVELPPLVLISQHITSPVGNEFLYQHIDFINRPTKE